MGPSQGHTLGPYPMGPRNLHFSSSDLTEKPHIQVPEHLESGRPARLSCSLPGSCEGGRPLIFSWAGAALESLSPQALRSSELTITPRPWDHGTNLTCEVTLHGALVPTERTIWLNVSCECWRAVGVVCVHVSVHVSVHVCVFRGGEREAELT